MFSLFTNIFRRAQTLFPAGTKLKKQSKRTEFIVPLYCLAVCCEVLRRWGWGRRWSRSSEEEPEASPVRRTTSTRTSRASCASLLRRLNTHTHTHTEVNMLCCGFTSIHRLLLLVPCRRGRASLNTGWTIYVPNLGRCSITSTSWRASQSVSLSPLPLSGLCF